MLQGGFRPGKRTKSPPGPGRAQRGVSLCSAKSKKDEAFKEKAHRITHELQNHRPGYYALWRELVKASISDIKSNFEKLNVSFDLWYGESDSDAYIPELVQILKDKGLLYESEGERL